MSENDARQQELFEAAAEQLRLIALPRASRRRTSPARRIPAKLRLDPQTREIGLAGVAEARAILAAQARRQAERDHPSHELAPRHAVARHDVAA